MSIGKMDAGDENNEDKSSKTVIVLDLTANLSL